MRTFLSVAAGLACTWAYALESPTGVIAILGKNGENAGGNAVIITGDGQAVTLAEALPGDQQPLTVVLPGGIRRTAEVLRRDPATTAVLIRVADPPAATRPLVVADSSRLGILDPVWTIGNSAGSIEFDGEAALSLGVVSGLYDIPTGTPPVRGHGGQELSSYRGPAIETDAAINDGNEGGALVDDAGRLVGLVSRNNVRERRLPVAVPLARVLSGLGLPSAATAPAGGGTAWRQAAEAAAPALTLVYIERLHGPGNPTGIPRPPRLATDVPEVDRERMQNWWDRYYHQQQILFTDQPVSAVALDGDLLLTAASNLHGDATRGRVLLPGGQLPCTLVARNLVLDLALLRCERPHGIAPVRFAATAPQLGERIALLGRHRGDSGWTATLGTISATTRRRTQSRLGLLQTDARANYGSLGGMLVAADGTVAGMCVMLGPEPHRPWLINSGVAMAVDCTRIRDALPALMAGTSTAQPPILGLGITMRRRDADLVIEKITAGTGAEAAGLKAGDVLVQVDGQRATSPEAVSRVLMRHQPGDRIAVEVRRDKADTTVQVELREFTP